MSSSQLLQTATLLWSAKEAMFKWYGNGGVDFRSHMHIAQLNGTDEEGLLECIFQKNQSHQLKVKYRLLNDLVISWVVSS